jgi:hypothetical protein
MAIVIDASFDVALEGPMLGIWFWCLFGLGIASTMIYRAASQCERDDRASIHVSPKPAFKHQARAAADNRLELCDRSVGNAPSPGAA